MLWEDPDLQGQVLHCSQELHMCDGWMESELRTCDGSMESELCDTTHS